MCLESNLEFFREKGLRSLGAVVKVWEMVEIWI